MNIHPTVKDKSFFQLPANEQYNRLLAFYYGMLHDYDKAATLASDYLNKANKE